MSSPRRKWKTSTKRENGARRLTTRPRPLLQVHLKAQTPRYDTNISFLLYKKRLFFFDGVVFFSVGLFPASDGTREAARPDDRRARRSDAAADPATKHAVV